MDYQGRALVIDPDVFAVRSLVPLLTADMAGKSILCRFMQDGFLGDKGAYYSTGVMMLDCSKLEHWNWEAELSGLFAGRNDYWDLLQLKTENPEHIGELDERWNSLDKLTADTCLLHFTRSCTQPWKSGLPMPDDVYDPTAPWPFAARLRRLVSKRPLRRYQRNPYADQERFFFDLLARCLVDGALPESFVHSEIAKSRLRADTFDLLEKSGFRSVSGSARQRQNLLDEFQLSP
jgi:hypothetical protein